MACLMCGVSSSHPDATHQPHTQSTIQIFSKTQEKAQEHVGSQSGWVVVLAEDIVEEEREEAPPPSPGHGDDIIENPTQRDVVNLEEDDVDSKEDCS